MRRKKGSVMNKGRERRWTESNNGHGVRRGSYSRRREKIMFREDREEDARIKRGTKTLRWKKGKQREECMECHEEIKIGKRKCLKMNKEKNV